MKLGELLSMIGKRKGLFFSAAIISFAAMLAFTLFLNKVDFEVKTTIKLDNNILLNPQEEAAGDKIYNNFSLTLKELDDISAIEYIQNNKNLGNNTSIIGYSQALSKLSSKEFMHSCINSHSFKTYLQEKDIILSPEQISIVEQTDSLSISITGKDKDKTKESYDKLVEIIPAYVEECIVKQLEAANNSLNSSILSQKQEVGKLIAEYSALKAQTGLSDISSLNSGIEILNSLSVLSSGISSNSAIRSKLDTLLSNDITPELNIKSVDFSGLNLAKTLVTYIIIEVIAALIIGLLSLFIINSRKVK